MPKVRVMSDLHLEFGPMTLEPCGEDVLAVVGDVGLGTDGALTLAHYAKAFSIPTVMVAGNHEFYHQGDIDQVLAKLREVAASEPLMTFLQDDIAVVAGCVFVGCTLWTDYCLNGQPEEAKTLARMSMNDHRLIRDDGRTFDPEQALIRH